MTQDILVQVIMIKAQLVTGFFKDLEMVFKKEMVKLTDLGV